MSLTTLLTQTASVITIGPTGTDAYNVPTFGDTDSTDYPCRLQETAAAEVSVGRDTVIADLLLFLPPDAVITAADRVTVDGVTYEVLGVPNAVQGGVGVHHIEAHVREVTG